MATMYSLFLGVLLTAACSVNGNGNSVLITFLCRSVAAAGPVPFLLTEKEPKGQGLVARLNCLLISGNKTNSLRSDKSDCLSEIIDNSLCLAQPRPFYLDNASSTSLQSLNLSPSKFLTIAVGCTSFLSKVFSDDFCFFLGKRRSLSGGEDNNKIENNKALLAESRQLIITIASAELGIKEATGNNDGTRVDNSLGLTHPRSFYLGSANSSICTMSKNVAFDIFKNLKEEAQSIVLNRVYELSAAKISSDEFLRTFCGKKYEPRHSLVPNFGSSSGIRAKHSANEDKRNLIIAIASAELGVKESTGNNDGTRVEQYLAYTGLTKGYDWCAAFISWVNGQAGLSQPRNPWSPALFPKAKSYKSTDKIQQADLFGIYSSRLKRIHHVGLIKEKQGQYILTIEGNSNDRVESRRRHQRTVYSYADWMD